MKNLWVAAVVALALFSGMVHAQDHLEKKKIENDCTLIPRSLLRGKRA